MSRAILKAVEKVQWLGVDDAIERGVWRAWVAGNRSGGCLEKIHCAVGRVCLKDMEGSRFWFHPDGAQLGWVQRPRGSPDLGCSSVQFCGIMLCFVCFWGETTVLPPKRQAESLTARGQRPPEGVAHIETQPYLVQSLLKIWMMRQCRRLVLRAVVQTMPPVLLLNLYTSSTCIQDPWRFIPVGQCVETTDSLHEGFLHSPFSELPTWQFRWNPPGETATCALGESS